MSRNSQPASCQPRRGSHLTYSSHFLGLERAQSTRILVFRLLRPLLLLLLYRYVTSPVLIAQSLTELNRIARACQKMVRAIFKNRDSFWSSFAEIMNDASEDEQEEDFMAPNSTHLRISTLQSKRAERLRKMMEDTGRKTSAWRDVDPRTDVVHRRGGGRHRG